MTRFLKEWDVVVRALEDGRQILLARKGGLLDDGGLFVPVFPEFFLFPTYLHQSEQVREALKPSELARYEWSLQGAPNKPPKKVPIRIFARLADAYRVTDLASLRRVESEHIWKSGFLEKRFEWGAEKGLTLVVVRAFRLDPPATIAVKPSFAGCRSWIEDDRNPPTAALRPVLSEEDFLTRRLNLRRALSAK